MPDFVIKSLDYGVLGMCAVMLIVTWRIIDREQSRDGSPRIGILRIAWSFMGFCLILGGLNTYIQIAQAKHKFEHEERLRHDAAVTSLETLRNVARPLLNTRGLLVNQLPDDLPQKEVLTSLLEELKKAFRDPATDPDIPEG